MSYTDLQLKNATQIAYLNLQQAVKSLIADGKKGPFTIRELIAEYIDFDLAKGDLRWEGKDIRDFKLQELVQYSSMRNLDKQIVSNLSDEVLDWKLVDIHDTIDENGFYGCVIESSSNDAIVAFRGSEGLDNYSGLVNDWAKADIMLLNTRETEQHKEVEKFANELIKRDVLTKYKNIATTGHSLGGNLASHFAIISSYEGKEPIFDKLSQAVNFDGPGVSEEYLEYFEDGVQKAGSKITHYKWSPVGNILMDIPGEKREFLDVAECSKEKSVLEKIKYDTFHKHDTRSLIFDKDGKAKRGKKCIFDSAFGRFTKMVDKFVPPTVTDQIYAIASAEFSKYAYETEDGKIGVRLSPFSKKGKKRLKKRSDLEIKCGDMKEGIVNCIGSYANDIAKTIAYKVQEPKTLVYLDR